MPVTVTLFENVWVPHTLVIPPTLEFGNSLKEGQVKRWDFSAGHGVIDFTDCGFTIQVHSSDPAKQPEVGQRVLVRMKDGCVDWDPIGSKIAAAIESWRAQCQCSGLDRFFMQAEFGEALIISPRAFIRDKDKVVKVPEPEDHRKLLKALREIIDLCKRRKMACLLSFLGNMPGHGGQIDLALFKPTMVLDVTSLTPCQHQAVDPTPQFPVLAVDLSSPMAAEIIKGLVEDNQLLKLCFDCRRPFQGLLHSPNPEIRAIPRNALDVQLAFSGSEEKSIPNVLALHQDQFGELAEAISQRISERAAEWSALHCSNKRALTIPIGTCHLECSLAELHGMEAIVGFIKPPSPRRPTSSQQNLS